MLWAVAATLLQDLFRNLWDMNPVLRPFGLQYEFVVAQVAPLRGGGQPLYRLLEFRSRSEGHTHEAVKQAHGRRTCIASSIASLLAASRRLDRSS